MSLYQSDRSLIPLRAEYRHSSEMLSQLLYGDSFEIIQKLNSWLQIQTSADGYIGWIESEGFHEIKKGAKIFVTDGLYPIKTPSGLINLPFGSNLTAQLMEEEEIQKLEEVISFTFEQKLEHFKSTFINAPYLWGGKSVLGIDCSGLTQLFAAFFTMKIKRNASQQAMEGLALSFESIQSGDFAFFNNDENRITHVGIVLDQDKILHASDYVRIDHLKQEGIFRSIDGKMSHKLHSIKRIISTLN